MKPGHVEGARFHQRKAEAMSRHGRSGASLRVADSMCSSWIMAGQNNGMERRALTAIPSA